MIRYRLKELIADMEFRENRRVTMDEITAKTGISRPTLSRIANVRSYSTTTDILDRLCEFFGCRLDQLAEYVPTQTTRSEAEK
ncbi:MAG: transcriptional regulator [gamma proteobacterium symbiont of Stewartia floridana]|nr:MAG: transcriptional regulator [gamma proteobacterium symbiont of Stewartia floridana]